MKIMLFNKKAMIMILYMQMIFIKCNDYIFDLLCLYPRLYNLYSGNILLCCNDGIYTYNSNFQKKLYFQEFENEILSYDADFVTINQYPNNGNAIVLTKNEFYFLSPEGKVIFKDNFLLENSGLFYTLAPFIYENNLYFVIGFINSSAFLNFLYYKINISTNKIELIKNYSPTINTGIEGIVGNNYVHGFACQMMAINDNNILACFCCHTYPNEIASFWININSEDLEVIDDSLKYLNLNQQGKFIKSVPSSDKSKALICFSELSGDGYYTIYDINTSSFSDPVKCMITGNTPSTFLVQYFSRTQEYIISSLNDKKLKFTKFDKDLNLIQNENLTTQIESSDFTLDDKYFNINNYCITLIPELENYIFIVDGNLDGDLSSKGYLFPNIFKPKEILPNPFTSSPLTNINPSTIISEFVQNSISESLSYSSQIITSKYNNTIISTFNNNSSTTFPLISTSMVNILSSSSLINSSTLMHKSSSTLTQKIEKKYEKENIQCSFEYFYKNVKTNECQKFCSHTELIKETCYINEINENNIMNITEHCRNLIGQIDLNKNIDITINGNNAVFQLVSSEVKDENIDKNISIIDFGECEKKLKKIFGIDYILILQIDIFLSTSTNIVMKYEVYDPYTLDKVNLSICKDMKINTYSPYSLSDEELALYANLKESGYDLFNQNDSFYLDFCTPYTTYDKTDVLLSDRRTDFYKNKTFCQENCTYKNFDHIHKKLQCECQVNDNNNIDNNIEEVNFFSNAILDSFKDFEKNTNIKVLKCIQLVFSKSGQIKNFGSYLFIIFILIYIILMIIFCKNGKKELFNIINTIINQKKKINAPLKKKHTNNKFKEYINNNKIIIYKNLIINSLKKGKKRKKRKIKKQRNSNKSVIQKTNSLLKINSFPKTSSKLVSPISPKKSSNLVNKINKNSTRFLMINNTIKSNKNNVFHKYNNIELNGLIYEKAIIYDKRSYCQYYCDLLQQKHLILFTFVSKIDYNLFIIKLIFIIYIWSFEIISKIFSFIK